MIDNCFFFLGWFVNMFFNVYLDGSTNFLTWNEESSNILAMRLAGNRVHNGRG